MGCKLAVSHRQVHAWVLWAGDPALAAGRVVPAPARAGSADSSTGPAQHQGCLLCSSAVYILFTSVTTEHSTEINPKSKVQLCPVTGELCYPLQLDLHALPLLWLTRTHSNHSPTKHGDGKWIPGSVYPSPPTNLSSWQGASPSLRSKQLLEHLSTLC